MKILQVISGRHVDGALEHCRLLSRQLVDWGHDVTILCRPDCWLWDRLNDGSVRLVANNLDRWPPANLRNVAAWVRREGFQVIHTHMSRAHLFGVLLRGLTGVPVVATAHSRHVQPHWRLNDRVIANSEATRRFHQRINWVRTGKVETIHCFVDLDRFSHPTERMRMRVRRQWRLGNEAPVIGVVGNVVPRKGHLYLFRALPELCRTFPDLRVVLAGRFHRSERYTRQLRRTLLQSGLARRVTWLGRRADMPDIIAGLDVLVVPSIEEPMGMAPLEAMASGTPVVASRTGGLKEIVRHGRTGLLVPPRDPEAIGRSVTRILRSDRLRRRLVEGGRKWVQGPYSPATLGRRIEACLERVAGVYRAA